MPLNHLTFPFLFSGKPFQASNNFQDLICELFYCFFVGVFLQTLKKTGFLSEHLSVTSTAAHSQKPLGSVPIIFGGTEGKTILVPKYLQTIQKDIKTGRTKIKHNKKGQKCRSNNKHEKLLPVSPSHYKSPIPFSHFTRWCLSHTLSSYSSNPGRGNSASLWERSENKAMPGTE